MKVRLRLKHLTVTVADRPAGDRVISQIVMSASPVLKLRRMRSGVFSTPELPVGCCCLIDVCDFIEYNRLTRIDNKTKLESSGSVGYSGIVVELRRSSH